MACPPRFTCEEMLIKLSKDRTEVHGTWLNWSLRILKDGRQQSHNGSLHNTAWMANNIMVCCHYDCFCIVSAIMCEPWLMSFAGQLVSDTRGLPTEHVSAAAQQRIRSPALSDPAKSKSPAVLWHIHFSRWACLQYISNPSHGRFIWLLLVPSGGDDVQQLCEAGEEEFLEIMALVGMASKPLHVRRLQKALQEWAVNPGESLNPSGPSLPSYCLSALWMEISLVCSEFPAVH